MEDYQKEMIIYGIYSFASSMLLVSLELYKSNLITNLIGFSYILIIVRCCVVLIMKKKGKL